MTFADELRALNACREAVLWVGDRTLEQAWRECKRSDWMLWLLHKLRIDTRRCAGLFALRVWHLVPANSQLAAAWAIDCALRGADDAASAAARDAAWGAASTAASAAASDAARAAASDAAWCAAWTAAWAAARDAAWGAARDAARAAASTAASAAASDAARAAAWGAARDAERRAQCDIIRDEIPLAVVRAALERRVK